jgi:hypothetical protein
MALTARRAIGRGKETMPEHFTIERARRDAREGKSASTQAGEFVREQIHHIRSGEHGARSAKQAIAIGLSEARRAGVKLPAPSSGSSGIRKRATRDLEKGRTRAKPSSKRQQATLRALRREGSVAASKGSLSAQARSAARRRGPKARSSAAAKAARTRRVGRTQASHAAAPST